MLEEAVVKKGEPIDEDAYMECEFQKVDFSGLDLSKKRFSNCRFIGCNWTATKVELTRLQDVSFLESKVMGVDFTLCDPNFLSLAFEKCLLNGCNFTEMVLKGAKFVESQVKECHFAQSNVKGGSFRGSNLEGSTFHQTNLEKCDFSEAENYAIDPLNNRLKGAKFSQVEALSLLKGLGIEIV